SCGPRHEKRLCSGLLTSRGGLLCWFIGQPGEHPRFPFGCRLPICLAQVLQVEHPFCNLPVDIRGLHRLRVAQGDLAGHCLSAEPLLKPLAVFQGDITTWPPNEAVCESVAAEYPQVGADAK